MVILVLLHIPILECLEKKRVINLYVYMKIHIPAKSISGTVCSRDVRTCRAKTGTFPEFHPEAVFPLDNANREGYNNIISDESVNRFIKGITPSECNDV